MIGRTVVKSTEVQCEKAKSGTLNNFKIVAPRFIWGNKNVPHKNALTPLPSPPLTGRGGERNSRVKILFNLVINPTPKGVGYVFVQLIPAFAFLTALSIQQMRSG